MLSCLPVSLFSEINSGRMAPEAWACYAAQLGLDAYDISILFVRDRTPSGLKKLRNALETSGLPLAMVAAYPDFSNPDPVVFERELIRSLSDISVAAELGGHYVRITAGQEYPGADLNRQLDHICLAFSVCAEYAEKWNIQLLWENHSKPGAWEQPDFNYDPAKLDAMLQRLRGGPVKMNYDIANAMLLGRGLDFLETCFPEIASVHINDVASVDPIRFAGVGDGTAPISETIGWLVSNGYRGLFSIEEASGHGLEGIEKYVLVTKRLLSSAECTR